MSKMKNTLGSIKGKSSIDEERISKLEDTAIGTIQKDAERKDSFRKMNRT